MNKVFIMVVEDNADNMLIITEILKKDPRIRYFNVRASGRQFFNFMAQDNIPPINMVLLDINLPGEDGFAVLQKIRVHPKLSHACVIAVSSAASVEDIVKAQEAGFDGFIGKPLRANRFFDQLGRIMNGESIWE